MNSFYITTPIYYATDTPHVGHAYTTLAADVVARYWRRKLGREHVFFSVGTDEHGQKVAEAIAKSGQESQAFVDTLAERYQAAWQILGIESDFFSRTTHAGHIGYAQQYFTALYEQGAIYKGAYDGIYCVGCEEYKNESDLVDGKCPLHPNLEPERKQEENYFFKLSEWAPKVKAAIEAGELQVGPATRRNEVLSRLSGDIHDISISRPGVSWGVPVPWDTSHTLYVWVEALLSYASAPEISGRPEVWPPTLHLMAKDILWFHAAIWPALLLAGGKQLPKQVFAHGFFTVDGQKMSKTVGNGIDPVALVEQWGVDPVRYFLLSAVPFGSDGDIQPTRFAEIYTADLANGIGNLLNRTVTLIGRASLTIEPSADISCPAVDEAIEELRLDDGLKVVMELVRDANQQLEKAEPWKMLSEHNHESSIMNHELVSVLTTAYRQLETIAAGLEPYLPETSAKILAQLKSGQPEPLFPRRDQ